MKNLIKEIAKIDENEADKIEVIKIISLSKLIEGGAAMFAQVNRNHHNVIVGPTAIIPLVRKILRVFVIS